ncbi:type II toxin-antitoxin system RelE/ParE family toxin [Planococcus lenghuensis]|uniref:Cytotoxin n=1 Tax=Planococcus lenghuensis TaxID=2213202 RepID=A0A1Q2KVI4_9BACL|nr:hypothetical protein [Planococcus lenghuensis]AQQ52228.1 hypothetical protein B0X71_03275 [Planococcus lenghuensis]
MAYQLDITNRFRRSYTKLSPELQDAVDDAIRTLANGRPYPVGLRAKKMKGHKFIFEASPTMACRITFEYENPDYMILRNVGEHDVTLKNP